MRATRPKIKLQQSAECARQVEDWLAAGNEIKRYDYAVPSEIHKDGVYQCSLCKVYKPQSAFRESKFTGQTKCIHCEAKFNPLKIAQ